MSYDCPYCSQQLFRPNSDGSKLKARTSMVILHKSGQLKGQLELNCSNCKRGVIIPATCTEEPLRKADPNRYVLAIH